MQSSEPLGLGDFRAAYCESRAAAHGLDPYRPEAVAGCERAADGLTDADDEDESAPAAPPARASIEPLAPFTFALLAPLAILPYAFASQLYLGSALVLVSVGIFALRRLTGLPLLVLAPAFALGAGVATFAHGTLVPVTLACVCLAGVLLRRGEDGWAGLVAAGTLLDPLVGIAVCTTLAVWRPLTRVPIAAAAVVVALLSGAALGTSGTAEYYFGVLPASLAKNAFDGSQYGLAYFLHEAGLGDTAARRAGLVWDVLVAASSIPLARRFACAFESSSAYATVPPAVVLVGGSFADLSHAALALPACCVALVLAPPARLRALCALVLIAVPWPNVAGALSRIPLALAHAPGLDSEAMSLAFKLPTWAGLFLLLMIVTRSNARPIAARIPWRAAER